MFDRYDDVTNGEYNLALCSPENDGALETQGHRVGFLVGPLIFLCKYFKLRSFKRLQLFFRPHFTKVKQ